MDSIPGNATGLDILAVDDISENLRLLEALLTRDGHRVRTAASGRDCLDAVARGKPDLILLDIIMPEMDGFQVYRQLKIDDDTRHIPVIFVTGSVNPLDAATARELGAAGYITKPFCSKELRDMVRSRGELCRSPGWGLRHVLRAEA